MQKGLKRGLDELLGDNAASLTVMSEVDINLIDPNPSQARKRFDYNKLQELSDSIKNVGVISPIIVCKNEGRYTIIAGERRWRASKMAGLKAMPVIVRTFDLIQQMEVSLIENLQRDDLNAIEEAEGIQALMEECGLTQEVTAQRLGKSRPAVANLLRLLSLNETVKEHVRAGRLSEGHARVLLMLAEDSARVETAALIISRGWNVRQTEAYIRSLLSKNDPAHVDKTREITEMERKLREILGAKISVQGNAGRGKICLHYESYEEFARIYDWFRLAGGEEISE